MESVGVYSVQWLSNLEVPLANKFYREYHFRGKAKRHEPCAVVRSEHNTIIACAYVRDYQTFTLLAGVAVAPAHQGCGVARLMLQQLTEVFDAHSYTFAYKHLQPLYESHGFKRVEPNSQPPSVSNVYQRYLNQGRAITMMVYEAE